MQPADRSTRSVPLRLWPAVVIVTVQWLAFFALPAAFPAAKLFAVLIGLAAGPILLLWWLFASRAPWLERLGAVAVMALGLVATPRLLHPSVAEGNVGFQFYMYVIPFLSLAFVLWALVSRRLGGGARWATMVAAILLACGSLTLVRNDGLTGDGAPEFSWRWSSTAEDRLLAATAGAPAPRPAPLSTAAAGSSVDWPGYRGPGRSGVLPGVRIDTDWAASPPVELWRRPVGPGTSSFAVGGGLLYTQEQRGEHEIVAAYRLTDGEPIWSHQDSARFDDPYVGAGPRATPTLADGRVFTLGATGLLNALDATTGAVLWSHDTAPGPDLPTWGYAGSPLVVDDRVITYTDSLAAYDAATGEPRWTTPIGESYASLHLLTIDGTEQVFLQRNAGASGYALTDGALLWEDPWPGIGILQPAATADGDLIVGQINDGAMPMGLRRISVAHKPAGWSVEERWATERLRPSFSAFVVHDGHAFGLDNKILTCIDVADGQRKWKGGRYGSGQVMLLPDQDLLLVLTEKGGVALVAATADGFDEVARFEAIEGRTWSQLALAGDVLLVRNAQEMAAFRLGLVG